MADDDTHQKAVRIFIYNKCGNVCIQKFTWCNFKYTHLNESYILIENSCVSSEGIEKSCFMETI